MDKAGLRRSWVDLEQPQASKYFHPLHVLQKTPSRPVFPKQKGSRGRCRLARPFGPKIKGVILRHLKFSLNLYAGNICGVGKSPYLCTPQSKGKRVFIEG